jgi:hypothetical protein
MLQIARDVKNALVVAEKDVTLTIPPPYGGDGHKLFFVVQEPYWNDLLAFLDQTIGER